MLLDKWLSFEQKVLISVVSAGLWIYFRTAACYEMIPRNHGFPVLFVMVWTYVNYYEPLSLPIGLLVLLSYTYVLGAFARMERSDAWAQIARA